MKKIYEKPLLELIDLESITNMALEISATKGTLNFGDNQGDTGSWSSFFGE